MAAALRAPSPTKETAPKETPQMTTTALDNTAPTKGRTIGAALEGES
ncbi:hypothetical protein MTX38_31050 [Rhodococcus sp. ARC_M13]|nr:MULTISPECIES: hypothetical protein [Rhodococcus]MCJ0901530.1 hypothetical protein [Rhodococcus sp. ARC_M13]UKO83693.1 hypothetical protein ITJ47_01080 [Rhodococcus erythropolis]